MGWLLLGTSAAPFSLRAPGGGCLPLPRPGSAPQKKKEAVGCLHRPSLKGGLRRGENNEKKPHLRWEVSPRRAWAGGTPAVPTLRRFQATNTAKGVDAKSGVMVAGLLSLPEAHVSVNTLPSCSLGREAFISSRHAQFYVAQARLCLRRLEAGYLHGFPTVDAFLY